MTHPLRTWRERRGISLDELAQKVGVRPSHLSMLERGLRGVSLDVALKLVATTDGEVPVDAFVKPTAASDTAGEAA